MSWRAIDEPWKAHAERLRSLSGLADSLDRLAEDWTPARPLVVTVEGAAEARRLIEAAGLDGPGTMRAPHYTTSAVGIVEEARIAGRRGLALYLDCGPEFRRAGVEALAAELANPEGAGPRMVIVDLSDPFRPDGPEPNERVSREYLKRGREIVAELRGAGLSS